MKKLLYYLKLLINTMFSFIENIILFVYLKNIIMLFNAFKKNNYIYNYF